MTKNATRELVIDGAMGEGGGQVLRSSLVLSICFHKPVKIINIRANRKKPGLMRQHLTAVNAAAKISNAETTGVELHSRQIEFVPDKVQADEYFFSIGTAGSTTLVLQTIILPLLFANGPSKVVIEGGTHNPLAPPFDFLQYCCLPLLKQMGATINAKLVRPGFFPLGKGCIQLEIEPVEKLKPISLLKRGEILKKETRILLSQLPQHIGEREVKVIKQRLDLSSENVVIDYIDTARSPGNTISVVIKSENITTVFTGFGQKGIRAEAVANRVADEVQHYLSSGVPVDQHLADQILLPTALARGGEFVTTTPTQHALTNIAVIEKFCSQQFSVQQMKNKNYLVQVSSADKE